MTIIPLDIFGLTKRQVRLIKISIYVSQRAKRIGNHLSRKFIENWYCHAGSAAIAIEKFDPYLLEGKEPLQKIPRFLKANPLRCGEQIIFNYPNQRKKIVEGIQEVIDHPAIFHICQERDDDLISMHTFIVIGTYNGELWVFEKKAAKEDFRITTVQDAMSEYPGDMICYARPLNLDLST